jgi:REP element-mobilizing transposase RayT
MSGDKGGGLRFPRSTLLPADTYANRESTFHVTIAAHAKVSRFSDAVMDAIWQDIISQPALGRVTLHAACLMPDHVHILLQPSAEDVHAFVGRWKSHTTRHAWATGHRGALWQPKMWDRSIRNERDLEETIRYIIDNPVEAGLTSNWEEWPWTWLPPEEPRPSAGA